MRFVFEPLGSLVTFQGGGTPPTENPCYWGGDIPWVSPKDMKVPEIGASEDTITAEAVANSAVSLIPMNSVLIVVRSGILARTVPVALTTRELTVNQDIKALVPGKRVTARYLHHFLRATEPELLAKVTKGATVHRLSTEILRTLRMPVPPLAEQQCIVDILDEAFEAIATATANAEKNLSNARELFTSGAEALLECGGKDWAEITLGDLCGIARGGSPRPIRDFLTDSVNGVNWIKISDATASNRVIYRTQKRIKFEGVSRSRQVYAGDLLLSNSMSFGRPYVLGVDGCIHDGWLVLSANPRRYERTFLWHLLGSPAIYRQFDRLAAGSTVRNLNIDLVSRVRIGLPPLAEQQRIAKRLDELETEVEELATTNRRKLTLLAELKQSLLTRAFSGELTASAPAVAVPAPANDNAFATPEHVANILALAYQRHADSGRHRTFGHVKAQKTLHMVESLGGVELGRQPWKDAAGPNDFAHMLKAEDWAREKRFFEFVRRPGGYDFKKLADYGKMLSTAKVAVEPIQAAIDRATDLLLPLDKQGAEVLATVHAAWNNLILDGVEPTDNAIVREARDDWHESKLKIAEAKFRDAISLIRKYGITPDGTAKRVAGQLKLL